MMLMSACLRQPNRVFVAKAMLALWLLLALVNGVHACALGAGQHGAAPTLPALQHLQGSDQDGHAPAVPTLCDASELAIAKSMPSDPSSTVAVLATGPVPPWAGWPVRHTPTAMPRAEAPLRAPGAPLVIRLLRLTI